MRAVVAVIGVALAGWAVGGLAARGAEPQQSPGEVLFENRCARCHGMAGDGEGGLAPALAGVIGRAIASRANFPYSAALKAKGGVWTAEALDSYIADPQAFAPGAEMDVISPDPAERAAIIEYLKTLR